MLISDMNVCGGEVVVFGTRVQAYTVANMIKDGVSEQEIMDDFGISEANIRECVDYAKFGGVVDINKDIDYRNVDLYVANPKGVYVKVKTPYAFRISPYDKTLETQTATENDYKELARNVVKFWFEDSDEMIVVYVEEVFIVDKRNITIYCNQRW